MEQAIKDQIAEIIALEVRRYLEIEEQALQLKRKTQSTPYDIGLSFRVSAHTHTMVTCICRALEVDEQEFKQVSTIGQPIAYFI